MLNAINIWKTSVYMIRKEKLMCFPIFSLKTRIYLQKP